MTASISERPAHPFYLRTEHEIAVWRALEAAAHEVRRLVATQFPSSVSEAELDETIRRQLIPQALAKQERLLPAGTQLPPFAGQVLFSVLRGYAELDPFFVDPEVSEVIVDGPDQEVYVE